VGRGDLVIVQEPLQHTFKILQAAVLYLGMFDGDPEHILVVFRFYFEDSFSRREQDVRNDGFGGDGQVVQSSAAESSDGAPPGHEVAGLPRAGEVHWHLSPVGQSIHI